VVHTALLGITNQPTRELLAIGIDSLACALADFKATSHLCICKYRVSIGCAKGLRVRKGIEERKGENWCITTKHPLHESDVLE
jgi:hypothetical protein